VKKVKRKIMYKKQIDNPLLQKSFKYSLAIIEMYKELQEDKHEYVMSKQLLRSSTSIGANLQEAIAAQSKKDFISKLSISLKEAYESRYWLNLLLYSKYLDNIDKQLTLLTEIIKMTAKSIINAKANLEKQNEI
jgi:four helix bundle protein